VAGDVGRARDTSVGNCPVTPSTVINAQPDQLLPQASLCGRPLTRYKSGLATEDTVAAAQLTLLLYSGRADNQLIKA
jgi:hypothetical protein